MGKKFRNFVVIVVTVGIAYYLWKEREKVQEQEAFEPYVEPAVDVISVEEDLQEEAAEPELEPEEEFEPALVAPTLIEEEEAVELVAVPSLSDETPAEGEDPVPDDAEDEAEIPEDEFEEPEPEFDDPEEEEDEEELLPQADEPGPIEDAESAKEPTWVKPVDGECPEGYPVKARFATGHFHVPGDRGYDKIVPDCCYPTPEDAEADGFTPSRWA